MTTTTITQTSEVTPSTPAAILREYAGQYGINLDGLNLRLIVNKTFAADEINKAWKLSQWNIEVTDNGGQLEATTLDAIAAVDNAKPEPHNKHWLHCTYIADDILGMKGAINAIGLHHDAHSLSQPEVRCIASEYLISNGVGQAIVPPVTDYGYWLGKLQKTIRSVDNNARVGLAEISQYQKHDGCIDMKQGLSKHESVIGILQQLSAIAGFLEGNIKDKDINYPSYIKRQNIPEKLTVHVGNTVVVAKVNQYSSTDDLLVANSNYGVPVFIATYHDDGKSIRGSARGIPGFNVFECLQCCSDVIGKHGGHPMAGGFSLPSENWKYFVESCVGFAHRSLKPSQLGQQVYIDAIVKLSDISDEFVTQVSTLQPFGVNSEPIFRANDIHIMDCKGIGDKGLKFNLCEDGDRYTRTFKGISWNLGEYAPLLEYCDIVFKVRHKWFRDERSIEIEVIGFKPTTK
ncbi:DHHA1 domain-containing protein [Nostoc sp. C117]|uniref:DHHA1 domain-containing protein n=1 Tax=Nostoc sp. C117 TaxID=3349875 RepID=UPI00370D8D6B